MSGLPLASKRLKSRVWRDVVCTDDVTKEIEGTLAKLALLLVQGDSGSLKSLDGGKKSLFVFLLILPMDDDVVHQAQNTGQVVRDLIHPSLEVLGGAGDTEEHLVKQNRSNGVMNVVK